MTRSTDPELNAALEQDAATLEAMGQDAGPPLEAIDLDNEYDEDPDDGEYEDCGLMADGQCTKAGSEECDWICGALDRLNDSCCPACGACPGFIGAECDETCEHAQKDINDAGWDPSLADEA